MYTVLIFSTSASLEMAFSPDAATQTAGSGFFMVTLGLSLFSSLLYSWLIVARKRRTWATLKCIGYTNGNISSIVLGQIIFTTLMGFIINIELLFHYAAAMTYYKMAAPAATMNTTLVGLLPVVITSIVFLFVQILGFVALRGKITKVRPMIALKKVGE
jgi:predicted lysophospholipase L1 biosynthesis ABC-type transport system permease subunit